jgi:hypothetical protein
VEQPTALPILEVYCEYQFCSRDAEEDEITSSYATSGHCMTHQRHTTNSITILPFDSESFKLCASNSGMLGTLPHVSLDRSIDNRGPVYTTPLPSPRLVVSASVAVCKCTRPRRWDP